MEILLPVGIILLTGLVGSIIVEIYDYVQMSRWMHQRHMRELKLAMRHPEFFSRTHDVSADEIRKALDIYKTSGVTTILPTGEVEVINEAEKLIQEANNRTVD